MAKNIFRNYLVTAETPSFGVTISLIARWITGYTLFVAAEAAITYGVVAGIGYSLIGSIVFFLLIPVANYIRLKSGKDESMSDFLQKRLTPLAYKIMMLLLFLSSLTGLYAIAVAGGMIIHTSSNISYEYGMLFFLIIGLLFASNYYLKTHIELNGLKIGLTFAFIILLLIDFFVIEGIADIYAGIRLYHPYLLIFNNNEMINFIILTLFIIFGQVISDNNTWQQFNKIGKKTGGTLVITGLIWLAIPFSFSILMLDVIYLGGFDNIFTVISDLFRKIQSPFLYVIIVTALIIILVITFKSYFYTSIHLFELNIQKKIEAKDTILISFIITLIFFILTTYYKLTVFELFLVFGVIYSSLAIPFLVIIFSKQKVTLLVPICIIIAIILGYLVMAYYSSFSGILVSIVVSTLPLLRLIITKLFNMRKSAMIQ